MDITTKISLTALILILLGMFALRFVTPEDTWICSNGVWVEHGHPRAPRPVHSCAPATLR